MGRMLLMSLSNILVEFSKVITGDKRFSLVVIGINLTFEPIWLPKLLCGFLQSCWILNDDILSTAFLIPSNKS